MPPLLPGGRSRARAISNSLRDAEPVCWWLDDIDAPEPRERLAGQNRTDLAVVGGGYSGLWTALLAKQQDPSREVVLLEGKTVGWAASGRNGGFCSASLTHGQANGLEWYPRDMPRLERLGRANLAGIVKTIDDFGIDCKLERSGELRVATESYQIGDLAADYERMLDFGDDAVLLDTAADPGGGQLAHLSRRGLGQGQDGAGGSGPAGVGTGRCLRVARRADPRAQPCHRLDRDGDQMLLTTDHGSLRADRVALGTNAFPSLLKRVRPYVIPVYDYAMATEPLSEAQLATIGWANRQGVGDAGNLFHYYRLTDDNCILWGGYDAIYYYGNRIAPSLDQRPETFRKLADHFFATFPQLEGLRFTNTWGGVIDTCSRFFPFFGSRLRGPGRLRGRLHRPRRGGQPVRRRGDARPAVGGEDRADEPADGPWEAGAVPPGAAAGGGGQHDPMVRGPGGRAGRAPQPLAAGAGPVRAGLRLLSLAPTVGK